MSIDPAELCLAHTKSFMYKACKTWKFMEMVSVFLRAVCTELQCLSSLSRQRIVLPSYHLRSMQELNCEHSQSLALADPGTQ